MEMNFKKIFSFIGFLATLIGSIPAAMPAPIYTDRVEPMNPAIRDAIRNGLTGIDGNPNGAQVRVTFELLPEEKFSCNDTEIKITIVGDLRPSPPGPQGGLVPQSTDPNSYNILESYASTGSQVFAGNAGNNCLYNFNLKRNHIGRKAFVRFSSPVMPSRNNGFVAQESTYPIAIKSLRQTFNLNARSFRGPS